MAYSTYDGYNSQVGFPLQRALSYGHPGQYAAHPSEYGYTDPVVAGAYGDQPYGAYPIYPSQRAMSQYGGRGYDDFADPYYDGDYTRQRRLSSRSLSRSMSRSMSRSRSRLGRASLDGYHRMSSSVIKFKRKGGFRSGVSLGEAMSDVHLSGNDNYNLYDLNADARGRIILKIRWTGYTSMTYELPVDGYDGRVELKTLARRIARACVHFLQSNMIPLSWDRVILYHLEEISPGTWQPVLSTS